jgi:predicted aspartyl protease
MATFKFPWNPFDPGDPGPCIKFAVSRYVDDIEYGKSIGLEFAEPPIPTALIDTGSPFTIINKVLARSCNLILTDPAFPIRTLQGDCPCEVYCGSISFPGSGLPRIAAARILARDFFKESSYSCLIGRDVLKQWDIRFDGQRRLVTINA